MHRGRRQLPTGFPSALFALKPFPLGLFSQQLPGAQSVAAHEESLSSLVNSNRMIGLHGQRLPDSRYYGSYVPARRSSRDRIEQLWPIGLSRDDRTG
jgi:hypothetical protein